MSTDPEKVTFGAIVEPTTHSSTTTTTTMPEETDFQYPSRSGDPLSTIEERDSSVRSGAPQLLSSRPATSATETMGTERDPANPFSAFYEHPAASREAQTPRSHLLHPDAARKNNPYVTETDVESGLGVPISAASTQLNLAGTSKLSIERSKECAMWPSKQTLLQQRKAEKNKARGRCDAWGRLTKKQRVIVQVLLAFLVVGAAVGVGVGISRAVGGGVWAGAGQTKQVPQDNDGN